MRKPFAPLFLLLVLLSFLISSPSYPFNLTLNNTPTQVYFSPGGGCTAAINVNTGSKFRYSCKKEQVLRLMPFWDRENGAEGSHAERRSQLN
jgi:hypothetical protein